MNYICISTHNCFESKGTKSYWLSSSKILVLQGSTLNFLYFTRKNIERPETIVVISHGRISLMKLSIAVQVKQQHDNSNQHINKHIIAKTKVKKLCSFSQQ